MFRLLSSSLLVSALMFAADVARLGAQRSVDLGRATTPTVSIRITGSFAELRIRGWDRDSVSLTGSIPADARLEGGFGSGARSGAGKFYLETKSGSANVDVAEVVGGLDLNIVGGSVKVNGKPRELLVESMDGAVTFTGFAEYAKIKTATGDIVLEGGGDDLTFTTVSGSIQAANGERQLQRLRLESVTGPITFAGALARGADLRLESHSGAMELRLPRPSNVEIDAATVLGTIENTWNQTRPVAGREGRGMELGISSGMSGARVQVRSFKGSIRLGAR